MDQSYQNGPWRTELASFTSKGHCRLSYFNIPMPREKRRSSFWPPDTVSVWLYDGNEWRRRKEIRSSDVNWPERTASLNTMKRERKDHVCSGTNELRRMPKRPKRDARHSWRAVRQKKNQKAQWPVVELVSIDMLQYDEVHLRLQAKSANSGSWFRCRKR